MSTVRLYNSRLLPVKVGVERIKVYVSGDVYGEPVDDGGERALLTYRDGEVLFRVKIVRNFVSTSTVE